MPKRIACIVGARPNFIKMAAILEEIRERQSLEKLLIHTGQHSSPEMSDRFFADLRLPAPTSFSASAAAPARSRPLRSCGGSKRLSRSTARTWCWWWAM